MSVRGGEGSERGATRKRLLYQARHRGFKEADLILGRFADAILTSLDDIELRAFEAILGRSDHDVYAWVVGGLAPPPEIDAAMIARLRAFVGSGGAALVLAT